MKRELVLLALSILLIGFAYADSVSFSPIKGNAVISADSGTAPAAINCINTDAENTGIGISVLFPLAAPFIIEYNLINAFLNRNENKMTGDIISIGSREIKITTKNDLVSSSIDTPGASITESDNSASITESDNSRKNKSEDEIKTRDNKRTEIKGNIEEKLREKEKTEITTQIIGTQSKIKIKEMFYTLSTAPADIIADIISNFAIDKENASSLLKIKTENEKDQSEVNQENNLKIEVNLNSKFSRVSIEKDFVLNTTDKDEILNSVVSESQLTADEIKNAIEIKDLKEVVKEKNRVKFTNRTLECPIDCTCTGSVVKCTLASGGVMTVTAGQSGNIIVQIKGENMTTNVTLYKSGDKVYGVFAGNDTREVKILPDKVKENIKARIKARLQNENITLDENGTYIYGGEKQTRLFFIIPIKVAVKAEINSETGEVTNIESNKWWSFLAKDEQA